MSIYRTLIDKSLIRFTRNKYESRLLRRYFKEQYDIDVGMYSYGFFDRWRIPPGTKVGRYSSIDKSARLIDANHPTSALSMHPLFYLSELGLVPQDRVRAVPPIVEDDVWMGHNSVATPGCKLIGRGAIIGAGSVVTRDVPRYAIMVGAPARLIKFRFRPEVIDAIEASRWWLLDKRELKRGLDHSDFLDNPSVESAAAFMSALGNHCQILEP